MLDNRGAPALAIPIMSSLNMTQTVPLTRDEEGVLRVIGCRVTV